MKLQVNCTDSDLNQYPPLFLNELEEALVLIQGDSVALEDMRQRVSALKARIETMQGKLKYGNMKTDINCCGGY